MYIVQVTRSTSHGPGTTPLLATEDLVKAVDFARSLDQREFPDVCGCDYGFNIYSLTEEREHRSDKVVAFIFGRRPKQLRVDSGEKIVWEEVWSSQAWSHAYEVDKRHTVAKR